MPHKQQTEAKIISSIAQPADDFRLKRALGAALVGTWERNLLTGEDFWSEQEEALFGLAPGSFSATHQDFLQLVHPADRAGVEEAARRAIEGSARYESDFRIHWPDGTVRWMIGRGDVIRDATGRATHMVGITMDITDRKLSEQRLATEHAVSRVLSNASSLRDAAPRILEAIRQITGWQWAALWTLEPNENALRCINCSRDSSTELTEFDQLSHAISFARNIGLPGRVWSTGQPAWISDVTKDSNFPRKDVAARAGLHGAVAFPVIVSSKLLGVMEFLSREVRPPDEAILAMMSSIGTQVGQFIENRQIERGLRQSEARTAAMMEAALDCIVTMNHQGHVIEWNPAAERTFGFTRSEAIGREMAELIIPPSLRNAHRKGLAHYLVTGEGPVIGKRLELSGIRKDGSEFPVELGITRIPGTDPPVFTGYLRDISDRKLAQEQLRRAKDQAEAANNAKDRFLAVLSHELRTPLSPVILAARDLELRANLPDDVREDVGMIRRNVELETRLIDDLLDLSRVSSGKLSLSSQDISLHHLLRHVLNIVASELRDKSLNVVVELSAECDNVRGDPARLQQVFWNLIKNAAKFSSQGGAITLRSECLAKDRVAVQISDTGIGIAAEALPRIFDAFEQGESTMTHMFGGLGLGLTIAKSVVDLHGGTLSAASAGPGKGATFTVTLPLSPAMAHDARPSASAPVNGGANTLRRARILLVEDHADTANLLTRLLERKGHVVCWATNAANALELTSSEKFDVVVSDIGLPDGTGYELMKTLRERYGYQGIAISGYGMDEDIRKSKEAGFGEHHVKPLNVDLLDNAIRRLSGMSR